MKGYFPPLPHLLCFQPLFGSAYWLREFFYHLVDDKDDQKTGKRKSNVENEMRKQQPFIGANGRWGKSYYT